MIEHKIGDLIYIKGTDLGPFVLLEKWIGIKQGDITISDKPCYILAKSTLARGYAFAVPPQGLPSDSMIFSKEICESRPINLRKLASKRRWWAKHGDSVSRALCGIAGILLALLGILMILIG